MPKDRVSSRVKPRGAMWFCRIKRKDHDIARSFERKIDAEIWEKQVIASIDSGTFKREDWIGDHGEITKRKQSSKPIALIPVREMTFGEALDKYSKEVTPKKKGASQELTKINKWLRYPIANHPLKDLDSADFAAWRDERLAEGVAPATIRNYLAIVSHLYSVARREWRIKLDNPIADVAKPRVNNARDRRLSQEEQSYLLDALKNPGSGAGNRKNKYVLPIYLFALETAMRQSEILGLEWQHIDLKKNTARLFDTKNGEDSSVPLSSKAVEILQSLQGTDIRKVRGPVFPTSASALKQSFARARERAKRNYKADCEKDGKEPNKGFLADFVYHDTRHEATSLFFERGDLDMMEVASITRHKDMRMLKRYTHLRAEKLAKKLG